MNSPRKNHKRTPHRLCQHDVLDAGTTPTACFEMVVISLYTYQVKHI
jgi:hypothetical protein